MDCVLWVIWKSFCNGYEGFALLLSREATTTIFAYQQYVHPVQPGDTLNEFFWKIGAQTDQRVVCEYMTDKHTYEHVDRTTTMSPTNICGNLQMLRTDKHMYKRTET